MKQSLMKERTRQKADYLFTVYLNMGVNRTLQGLSDLCGQLKVRGVSIQTLNRYSVVYGWQARLIEAGKLQQEQVETQAKQEVEQMNKRHAEFSKTLLGLAMAGANKYQKQLQANQEAGKGSILDIDVQDITKLYETAQKGERLARGQATSRVEVIIEVLSLVVQEFALVFLGINQLPTPQEREQEWAKRCDALLEKYYPKQVTKGGVDG